MSIDTLLLSVLFIVSFLAFFGGARVEVEPAVEPISESVLDAVYDDPTPELQAFEPVPDPWKPSFVDAVVPFKHPAKRVCVESLSAAEIRELCRKHQISCPGRGRIGKHVLSRLAEAVA